MDNFKYTITDIEWDTEVDGEVLDADELHLPKEYVLEGSGEVPFSEDEIADILSDTFGYCIYGFKCETSKVLDI